MHNCVGSWVSRFSGAVVLFAIVAHGSGAAQPPEPNADGDPEAAMLEQELAQLRTHFPLRVVGRVVDARTGKVIPEFYIIPGYGPASMPRLDYAASITARDGQFEWPNDQQRPGLLLRIEAYGYSPVLLANLSHDIVASVEVKLHQAVNIEGVVVSPDGTPAAGADVRVFSSSVQLHMNPSNGQAVQSTQTDDDGRFVLRPEKGDWCLDVAHRSGMAEVDGARYRRDQPVQLEAWGRIEGVARIGAELAPAGTRLVIRWPTPDRTAARPHGMSVLETTTGENGRFVFERVPPRQGRVCRMITIPLGESRAAGGWTEGQSFDLKPGETMALEVGGSGRPVTAQLITAGDEIPGTWAPEVSLRRRYPPPLRDAPSIQHDYRIDANGRLHIDEVEPGSYQLEVYFTDSVATGEVGWRPVARAHHAFSVDQIPGGRTEEPLDIGEIAVQAVRR